MDIEKSVPATQEPQRRTMTLRESLTEAFNLPAEPAVDNFRLITQNEIDRFLKRLNPYFEKNHLFFGQTELQQVVYMLYMLGDGNSFDLNQAKAVVLDALNLPLPDSTKVELADTVMLKLYRAGFICPETESVDGRFSYRCRPAGAMRELTSLAEETMTRADLNLYRRKGFIFNQSFENYGKRNIAGIRQIGPTRIGRLQEIRLIKEDDMPATAAFEAVIGSCLPSEARLR